MLTRLNKIFITKSKLTFFPLRFVNQQNRKLDRTASVLESENTIYDDHKLEPTEVETRIMHVIHKFHIMDLTKFDWFKEFEDLGLDSLEQTAIITSIEHEFNTVFEDKVFDNFVNFHQVKQYICNDHSCF